jgi:DNA-directed RNA polymerase subunit RPC12/RpoP
MDQVMSCPHCGCRMLSKESSRHRSLICSDCGHPMTEHLRISRPERGWRDLAAIALVVGMGFSAMGLTTLKTALVDSPQGLLAPAHRQASAE